ncbi:uncharacterized protein BX663DRAFT_551878 [Cokeromyces recurvatus]|uniref:uncharacterized protein n=1 Tax=Cokeromyces recurvatus TaxID=90255 RepID=UPI00221EA250|nr:uncharacterized protein BX663DRAFT_551878 [Cokeromyces recurvatus]KAI7903022.1 hypothetical protein BX663DRAFT_551878 [Cokeromyces recurvatus]
MYQQQYEIFMDNIFEPPPDYRRMNTAALSSPTYDSSNTSIENDVIPQHPSRSPLHHQPSLTEIVYEDLNRNNDMNEVEGNESIYYETTMSTINNDTSQIDSCSIATSSLFTAIDESDDNDENEHDSSSNNSDASTTTTEKPIKLSNINELMKDLNIQHDEWEDYRPKYKALNDSYINTKHEIYKEIYTTMQKIHELDDDFSNVKLKVFQFNMLEKDYKEMTRRLLYQCQELIKQKEAYKNDHLITTLRKKSQQQNNNEKIRLNIGGNVFETSLSTLQRDRNSLLAAMFSGRHPNMMSSLEDDGSYFIDRDPSHFRFILNYLRDLRIPPTILQDLKIRQELLQEAKYYRIEGLQNNNYRNKVTIDENHGYGFSVKYFDNYKVVENLITNEKYALVCCNQSLSNFTFSGYHAVVNTPLNYIGVENELEVLPFFELLGISDKVKLINPSANITSPCFNGINSTTITPVEAIFTTKSTTTVGGLPHYISISSATSENLTPIQQSAWILFIAHFFEIEQRGLDIFTSISDKYQCHQSNLKKAGTKKIAWTTYDVIKKVWTLNYDLYTSKLIQDAGFELIGVNKRTTSFQNITLFHNQLQNVEYIIDNTDFLKSEISYADWLSAIELTPNSNKYDFLTLQNVYRTDNLISASGFSDWSIRHHARADLALADIIHMVYSTYEPSYNMTWLRAFAQADGPKFITNESYPSCSATSQMERLNLNRCTLQPFQPNKTNNDEIILENQEGGSKNSSLLSSTSSKVGVAIGVVVGITAIGVISFFAYQKRRVNRLKGKQEGRFYKMNDIGSSP